LGRRGSGSERSTRKKKTPGGLKRKNTVQDGIPEALQGKCETQMEDYPTCFFPRIWSTRGRGEVRMIRNLQGRKEKGRWEKKGA